MTRKELQVQPPGTQLVIAAATSLALAAILSVAVACGARVNTVDASGGTGTRSSLGAVRDHAEAAKPSGPVSPQAPADDPTGVSDLDDGVVGSGALADGRPTHYYLWNRVTPRYRGPRDSHGVVMTRNEGRVVYNPVGAALWALHFHENWLQTGSAADRADFLAQARWLRSIQDRRGRLPYTYAKRGARPPWYSAMAQGLAMSVFVRAAMETGDDAFITAAKRAAEPFGSDVADGGVVTMGGRWLEEYPDRRHVLNGSMFAAFGLWDLMRATGTTDTPAGVGATIARRVWSAYTHNLAANLGRYESHGAILYELSEDSYCHVAYFDLQLRQLRVLSLLARNPVFSNTADRWEASFRPYPEVSVTAKAVVIGRGRVLLRGRVGFLYPAYYGQTPHVRISVTEHEGRDAVHYEVPLVWERSRTSAVFQCTVPAGRNGTTGQVALVEQPRTRYRDGRYDYAQHTTATFTVGGKAP